ncbi:MAG: Uma2 family endonuclease [Bacteroidota bacterium]
MTNEENLVYKVLAQTDAAIIINEVQQQLDAEKQKRIEFYNLIQEDDKAEFINGEIVFHSPVMKVHTDANGRLYNLLMNYVEEKNLGWVGIEKALTQFSRNDYEPDICFFGTEKASQFEDDQLLYPIPDFVVEILSKSSKKNIERDTVTKYKDYERHGVVEYWIVDPHEKTVSQYVLQNKKYKLILKSSEGTIRSRVVTGFNIPIVAIFDSQKNRETLRLILTDDL